jgi:spore maturation protein CgeB
MRIFYVAQTTPNEIGLPASRIWHANLYLPLVDLGHELIPFTHPWLSEGYNQDLRFPEHERRSRQHRADFSQRLLDAVKEAHRTQPVRAFFSYLTSAHVEPEAIREIGRLGITTLNWYCNASFQFHNVAEIAPAFHHCLVPEKFRLGDYRQVGAHPIYCQEAANPNVYRPHDLPREFDVTFVGQSYGNRPVCLRRLIDAGIDARVWGPGWQLPPTPAWRRVGRSIKHRLLGRPLAVPPNLCGPPLSDDELVRMYSRSKISLGFTTVAEQPRDGSPAIKQVRLRDFEATMSGAFYLVERFDELAEFFEPDREIVFFRDAEELVDKARYYLAHDTERERIRQAGLKRARAEHTWQRRFQTVFDQIGLK